MSHEQSAARRTPGGASSNHHSGATSEHHIVLFGPLHLARKGWAGGLAILLSAITLLGVVLVVHRVLRLLDDRALARMRRRRLSGLILEAMRAQLTAQVADYWLGQTALPIKRELFLGQSGYELKADHEGWLTDIRLGPLLRWRRRTASGDQVLFRLHAGLGNHYADEDMLMTCAVEPRARALRRLRAAFVLNERIEEPADQQLRQMVDRLHGDAMDAARSGHERDWREISESYERVLLGLPRAAKTWGFKYEGAIMGAGIFGQGPVHRISEYIYDELAVAVANNHRDLVATMTFFPQHVGLEATRLGAPSVARPLLSLYPRMYQLAVQA